MKFNEQTCTVSSWDDSDSMTMRRLVFTAKRLDMPRIYYIASEFIPDCDEDGNSVVYTLKRDGKKILMVSRLKGGKWLREMRQEGYLPVRYRE